MAHIIHRNHWARQPQVPVGIDRGHPLARNLSAVIDAVTGVNLLTQGRSTFTGTKLLTHTPGRVRGFGSTFGSGTTDNIVSSHSTNKAVRSYFMWGWRNGDGGGGFGRMFDKQSGGTSTPLLHNVSGESRLYFSHGFSGGIGQWGITYPTISTWYSIGVSYDNSSTSNDPSLYLNGVPISVDLEVTPSGTANTSTDPFSIGNRTSDGIRSWDGMLGNLYVWDDILLPAAAFAEMHENQWQVFAPLRRRIYVGTGAAAAYTLTAAPGSFALTGQAATLTTQRLLTAAQASFTLTGNAATITTQRSITAAQASFTLTGSAAGLTAQRLLTAAQASFTLTGNAAALNHGYALTAATGTFTLTGNAAGLTAQRLLTAAHGAFTLTGQDAALTYSAGTTLVAATGTFTLTGNAAGLTAQRRITAAQASFTLTGNAAVLSRGYSLAAAGGSFTLTGQSANLTAQRLLSAASGIFALSGQVASLLYSGAEMIDAAAELSVTRKLRTLTVARQRRTLSVRPRR